MSNSRIKGLGWVWGIKTEKLTNALCPMPYAQSPQIAYINDKLYLIGILKYL